MDSDIVKKAIDDEPELPGDIPDRMYETLRDAFEKGDRDLIIEAFRIVVRQTKQGIKERLSIP